MYNLACLLVSTLFNSQLGSLVSEPLWLYPLVLLGYTISQQTPDSLAPQHTPLCNLPQAIVFRSVLEMFPLGLGTQPNVLIGCRFL